jgi:ABC-2 type transport system permease protein
MNGPGDTNALQAGRRLPGALSAGLIVARLFFRVTLGRRRTLWVGLLMLLPVLLALWYRLFESGEGPDFFNKAVLGFFLQFAALGLSLYFGVSAVRDEIEDKTIVYLFARPVSRGVILGGKILAVVAVLAFGIAVDTGLVYLITVSKDGAMALVTNLDRLAQAVGVLALATLAYTAFFSLIGVLLNKPMIVALLIGFGYELVVSNLPGGIPQITLMFYLKSLLGVAPEGMQIFAFMVPGIGTASIVLSLTVALLCAAIFLFLALFIGSRKEYRV